MRCIYLAFRTIYFTANYLKFQGVDIGHFGEENVINISNDVSILWLLLIDMVLWISFFNWRKSIQLSRTKWRTQLQLIDNINNTDITAKKPWTLRYGKLLSNQKFLLSLVTIFWLCFVAITTFSSS